MGRGGRGTGSWGGGLEGQAVGEVWFEGQVVVGVPRGTGSWGGGGLKGQVVGEGD